MFTGSTALIAVHRRFSSRRHEAHSLFIAQRLDSRRRAAARLVRRAQRTRRGARQLPRATDSISESPGCRERIHSPAAARSWATLLSPTPAGPDHGKAAGLIARR